MYTINKLQHRKCFVQIFNHSLQNAHSFVFMPKFCNSWIKIRTSHFLWRNLYERDHFEVTLLHTRRIEWSLRALASMRAARLFLRARAVIKYVLQAASTLKNSNGEQRALRKFSRRIYWKEMYYVMQSGRYRWTNSPAAYSQLGLVGDDVKLYHLASPSAVH